MQVSADVTIFVDPDRPDNRRAVAELMVGQRGLNQSSRPADWSVIEAITWIATGDGDMVAGVTPFQMDAVTAVIRGFGVDFVFGIGEGFVAPVVAEDIARGFCTCARKVANCLDTRDWTALSMTERAVAKLDATSKHHWIYKGAHTVRCVCFDTAARALFTAAASGEIGAVTNGRDPVSRLAWHEADYDLEKGLRLLVPSVADITFSAIKIRRRWPAAGLPESTRKIGRPESDKDAVELAFRNRRAVGKPLETLMVREWRLCIADARAAGAQNLGKPETYVGALRDLYDAAAECLSSTVTLASLSV